MFLRGALRQQPQNDDPADALAHVRLDRLRREHVQRAGRGVLGRQRSAETGGRRDGRGDGRRRPDARAHHRPGDRRTPTSRARGSRCRIGSTARRQRAQSACRTKSASRPGCSATTRCSGSRSTRWARSGSARGSTRSIDGDGITMTTSNVTALHVIFDKGSRLSRLAHGRMLRLTARRCGCRPSRPTNRLPPGRSKDGDAGGSARCRRTSSQEPTVCQGPIDDAFMDGSCSCARRVSRSATAMGQVGAASRLTTRPASGCTSSAASRGVKNDTDVTAADHRRAQPGALRRSVEQRDLQADRGADCRFGGRADGVAVGGQQFDANHAPVFIFPNPLNPKKYVVINSGFTFHDQSNNDMQSPKLPTGPSSISPSPATTTSTCRCSSSRRGSSTRHGRSRRG